MSIQFWLFSMEGIEEVYLGNGNVPEELIKPAACLRSDSVQDASDMIEWLASHRKESEAIAECHCFMGKVAGFAGKPEAVINDALDEDHWDRVGFVPAVFGPERLGKLSAEFYQLDMNAVEEDMNRIRGRNSKYYRRYIESWGKVVEEAAESGQYLMMANGKVFS